MSVPNSVIEPCEMAGDNGLQSLVNYPIGGT